MNQTADHPRGDTVSPRAGRRVATPGAGTAAIR
jgi:hypothetical protein